MLVTSLLHVKQKNSTLPLSPLQSHSKKILHLPHKPAFMASQSVLYRLQIWWKVHWANWKTSTLLNCNLCAMAYTHYRLPPLLSVSADQCPLVSPLPLSRRGTFLLPRKACLDLFSLSTLSNPLALGNHWSAFHLSIVCLLFQGFPRKGIMHYFVCFLLA